MARGMTAKELSEDTIPFGGCPDCGLPLHVILDEKGVYPQEIMHMTPMCETFDKMEADAYLTRVLDIREAQRHPIIEE